MSEEYGSSGAPGITLEQTEHAVDQLDRLGYIKLRVDPVNPGAEFTPLFQLHFAVALEDARGKNAYERVNAAVVTLLSQTPAAKKPLSPCEVYVASHLVLSMIEHPELANPKQAGSLEKILH